MADITDWPTICNLREAERTNLNEIEVYKCVNSQLAEKLAQTSLRVLDIAESVKAKDTQLQAALADVVNVRSAFTHKGDLLTRVADMERSHAEAVDALEGAKSKYAEDVRNVAFRVEDVQKRHARAVELETLYIATCKERDRYHSCHLDIDKKLTEWKTKVAAALKEQKDKEKQLESELQMLRAQKVELLEDTEKTKGRTEAAREKGLRRSLAASKEVQTGDVPAPPLPPMDMIVAVRYTLPDNTTLESKLCVKDTVLIEELVGLCCSKISIRSNQELDPDMHCLRFTMANQIRAPTAGPPGPRAQEKEYVLSGNREIRSWTALKQFIMAGDPVVLTLDIKTVGSPTMKLRSAVNKLNMMRAFASPLKGAAAGTRTFENS
eukprot:PhF_6_TR42865/c0_g1_i1/m.64932